MPASLFASFMVFFLIGIYTIADTVFVLKKDITGSLSADLLIYLSIVINAIFFYYFEAFAELDEIERKRLQTKSIWEWIVRVLNHAILLSLWLALQNSFLWFSVLWVVFYFLMFIWDVIVYKDEERPTLQRWDILGFFFTIVFLTAMFAVKEITHEGKYADLILKITDLQTLMLALGGMIVAYIVLIRFAAKEIHFNIFEYFKRTNLS